MKPDKFYLNNIYRQTWQMFEEAICDKKVVLFGVSYLLSFYFLRYSAMPVEMIVDNDQNKQGMYLGDYDVGNLSEENKKKKISCFFEFEMLQPNETVVLIASEKHDIDIAVQLQQAGFFHFFSIRIMEQKCLGESGECCQSLRERFRQQYINECQNIPIKNNKLIFYTEGGFCDHGRQIAQQLFALREDLDILWIVKDETVETPVNIRKIVRSKFFEFFYEMSTALFWIFSDVTPGQVPKRAGQIYIQTKHWASVTLKTFGLDFYKFRNIRDGVELLERDCQAIDYVIVGSIFDETTCRRAFQFNGSVIKVGSPRTDVLFHPDQYRKWIQERYHIDEDRGILLYVPTFRGGTGDKYVMERHTFSLDFQKISQALGQKYKKKWVVLLRLHPVLEQNYGEGAEDWLIDVCDYGDSQELVAASDVVITDYSSIMFEPAFVYKPVFLFAPDQDEYINKERKLLIEYNQLPFDIAKTNEELCEAIIEFDKQKYDKKLADFFERYGVHEDGHASERAAGFINNLLDKYR